MTREEYNKVIHLYFVVISLPFRRLLTDDNFISICKAIKQISESEIKKGRDLKKMKWLLLK